MHNCPLTFVKIKIASLKWAWRQKPNKGWCEAPPSIIHRFRNSSHFGFTFGFRNTSSSKKTEMLALMEALEIAMLWLSKHASAVADKKLRVQWVAEVEITLMSMIFAAPKFDPNGQTTREQEKALAIACGEFIAGKLVDLVKLASQPLTVEHLKNMTYPQNDIFASVKTALENGNSGKDKGTANYQQL